MRISLVAYTKHFISFTYHYSTHHAPRCHYIDPRILSLINHLAIRINHLNYIHRYEMTYVSQPVLTSLFYNVPYTL